MLDAVEAGELCGQITDSRSVDVVTEAVIRVQDTDLETATAEHGAVSFDSMYEVIYQLKLEASGYVDKQDEVEISAGEITTIALDMDPIDVAHLNDNENAIRSILNQQGIPAEEQEWDTIMEALAD